MNEDLVIYSAFRELIASVEETRRIEINIVSMNRAEYAGLTFDLDKVIGLAKDLRLIEYKVSDTYGNGATKTITVYPYGENDDADPGVIKRRELDPSGNWSKYFRTEVFRTGPSGNERGAGDMGGSQDHLSSGNKKAKLLGTPSTGLADGTR